MDSIIRQTGELLHAIEENRIKDAARLYSMRKRNLSILSNIKTEDLNKLNNYPAFMACLHDFNARIASV